MIITHIIGNGFDINQGIPTSYAHFYEYYLQLVPDAKETDAVKQFRNQMYSDLKNKRTDLWSDMELALGRVTKDYKEPNDFETAYMDVYNHLMEYIDKAYKYSKVEQFDNPTTTLYQDLMKPWLHLLPRDTVTIEQSIRNNTENHINVLSFNYTDTFNRLAELKKHEGGVLGMEPHTKYYYGGCKHIHHSIDTKDIILGVDNEQQIANSDLASIDSIRNILVKPQTNRELGTLIDRDCLEVISKSDMISLYGVSLGATDHTWWTEIGKRIKKNSDVIVLYFPFVNGIEQLAEIQKPTLRNNKKRELMDAFGIDKSNYKIFENRIFVNFSNNSGRRNIFSNPKRANINDNFEDIMARFQDDGKIVKPDVKKKDPLMVDLIPPHVETSLFEPKRYRARTISYQSTARK